MKRILVQAGHVRPLEPGFPGTGTHGEAEFTDKASKELVRLLRKDGRFQVTLCGGLITRGTYDVFLSLHADGSGNTAAQGFSFGYPATTAGNSVRLSNLITGKFIELNHPGYRRSDNYTRDMRGYYGFSRVQAPTKLLVEHGFLTNPEEEEWLYDNNLAVAKAHYKALVAFFQMPERRSYTVIGWHPVLKVKKKIWTRTPGKAVTRLVNWGASLVSVRRK